MTQDTLFHLDAPPPEKKKPKPEKHWLAVILKDPPRRHPRRTHWQACPYCGLIILIGDDDDHMAITVRADPTPLNNNPPAEAQALLQHRRLFQALPSTIPNHYRLNWIIPHPSHRTGVSPLLPQHDCKHGYLAPPTLATRPNPGTNDPDHLPF